MALETFGFITDLVPANPSGATDAKNQGDDHLRGLKTTLQNNFPDASTAFHFPKTLAVTGNAAVTAVHNNAVLLCDATSGPITLSLASVATLGPRFKFAAIKVDGSANAVTVDPAGAETIDGAATTVILGQYVGYEFVCTGFQWFRLQGRGGENLAAGSDVLLGVDATKGVSSAAVAALWKKGGTIASANTINVGEGGVFHVTGNTGILDINFTGSGDGRLAWLIFDSDGGQINHNPTTLIIPGGLGIAWKAGDTALVVRDSSGKTIMLSYMRAATQPNPDSVLLVSGSLFSSSADLSMAFGGTGYASYDLIFSNFRPAVDGDRLLLFLSQNGSTFHNSGYQGAFNYFDDSAATNSVSFGSTTFCDLVPNVVGNAAGEGIAGSIRFYQPDVASLKPRFTFETIAVTSHATPRMMFTKGGYTHNVAQVAAAFKLAFQSGNILAGGYYSLYGNRT